MVINCCFNLAILDSIYTERYLRLPLAEDNLEGYIRSRLSTLYEGFRNKKYFLIHGTLDDNVHYQQAMVLARTLEQHDILFKQQVSGFWITENDEYVNWLNVFLSLCFIELHGWKSWIGECTTTSLSFTK